MSDSCMYEFEDIWDDVCQSDDHIVPHPLDDSRKENISNNTEDRPSAGNVDQESEERSFSSLSKRKNRMLERDSRSHAPSGVFSSSADGDSIKEASSLASKNPTSSSHVFKNSNTDSHGNELCVDDTIIGERTTDIDNNSTDPLGDITHTGNNLDLFENAEMKDSSDFLYYGWPEIENFEDVDRIFRSCDSTFGLGARREDELDWFSSSDNIGGIEEFVNSDVEFSCPGSNSVENLPTNHDFLKTHSSNDTAMMTAPVRLRDGPWISEKPDSYTSFVNESAIVNGEEGFTPKAHMNEHHKQVKLQNQSVEKREEHSFRNGSIDCTSKFANEAVQLCSRAKSHQAFSCQQQPHHTLAPDSCNYLQNQLLYAHSDNSPSGLTSVIPTSSAVKTETNELTSPSTRDCSRAKSHQAFSCQQQPQHTLAPDSCNYLQNHLLYAHSDNSPSSGLTSVIPTSSAVKTETNELTSPSTRDSSNESNLVPSMDGSNDLPQPVTAPTGIGKREKLHHCYDSRSPIDSSIKPANIVVQATSSDPGSMAKETHYVGHKSENHSDIEESHPFIPAELGSSNIQECSTSSGIDDVSLEAASFRQLQLVMEQLDLRTKICIRDSLYRLARSAEQRHTYANLNSSCGDGRDASGALMTEGEKSFMDIETDTNPIDRSVAHLLFHRPSESSPAYAQDSLPLKSLTTVRGSVMSRAVMETMIDSEEAAPDKRL